MTPMWIFIFTLFFYKPKVVSSSQCPKDNYQINKTGIISCFPCNSCPEGQGLSPPCGSVIDHPPKIECFPCVLGKTFSTDHGPSSCKRCHRCSDHEIVNKPCTVISDTNCSNTCEYGYYYEKSSHGCAPCSYCCGDDDDIKIPACKSMGLKQCTFINSPKCTPAPPSMITPTSIVITTTTAVSSTDASIQGKKEKIIAGAIGGCVVALIILLVMCYLRKRRKKQKQPIAKNNQPHMANGDIENGEGVRLQCSLNNLHCYLRIPNYIGPEGQPEKLPEESHLLLKVFCENENDNCFKKSVCSWHKDGAPRNTQERQLEVNSLKVSDSGIYKVHLHCQDHDSDKDCEMFIHVLPKPGHEYKFLSNISYDAQVTIGQTLKRSSKTPGLGDWRHVGEYYGLDSDTLKDIEDDDGRGLKVLDFIFQKRPELTVFEFCEFLKTKNQMGLVKKLENDLTKNVANNGESLDVTRDSGIGFDELCNLTVNLPEMPSSEPTCDNPDVPSIHVEPSPPQVVTVPQRMLRDINPSINPSYSDSSREGSLDNLDLLPENGRKVTLIRKNSSQSGKKKRKPSYSRQPSKDSQKSGGNVSISSLTAKIKFSKNQNDNYLEQEDTDDSEIL